MLNVFSFLTCAQLEQCRRVSQACRKQASGEVLWKEAIDNQYIIGKKKFDRYLGTVDEEPSRPDDIYAFLKSPSHFWPKKSNAQTGLFLLIPPTVNKKPFTLNSLGELVKAPKKGNATCYRYISPSVVTAHGDTSEEKAHWIFLTKTVIDGTRNKSFAEQKAIVKKVSAESKVDYRVPKALYVATAAFMNYVTSGEKKERLFNDDPWTFTRCPAQVNRLPVVVGGFASDGLSVRCDNFGDQYHGVAAVLIKSDNSDE